MRKEQKKLMKAMSSKNKSLPSECADEQTGKLKLVTFNLKGRGIFVGISSLKGNQGFGCNALMGSK